MLTLSLKVFLYCLSDVSIKIARKCWNNWAPMRRKKSSKDQAPDIFQFRMFLTSLKRLKSVWRIHKEKKGFCNCW